MRFPYVFGYNVGDSYPDVRLSIEEITPEIASEMLKANVHNRDMKRESICKAIQNGEWCLNGATIVFADDGVLLDGQNRLKACVDSGLPIVTIVVRGLGKNTQTTMDTGVRRQLCDQLKLMGIPNYKTIASMTVAMQRVDGNDIGVAFYRKHNNDVTITSSLAYFHENYESRIKPMYSYVSEVVAKYRGVKCGVLAVTLEYIKNNSTYDDFRMFIDQICGKAIPCDAVLTLKNRLEANSLAKVSDRLSQTVIAAFIIKTFNAYMLGEPIGCLKFMQGGAHPESFPTIKQIQ